MTVLLAVSLLANTVLAVALWWALRTRVTHTFYWDDE